MSNVLEYTLSLKDLLSSKLQKIGITNEAMLEKFSKLEKQSNEVSKSFKNLGTSVTTLKQKIDLLKAERDLLPVGNLSAIRKYNSEIHKLERSVSKLETLNGNKVKTWFQDALNSLPGIATNPLILLGGTIAKSVQLGMEADMQKANLMTLLKGDAEGVKALYAKISDYGVKTPYDKAGLIEAQKTMMSFGLNSDFAFEKLQNIGDIALGDANKMQSLALAFSQASSAGKLQGQDLLQMINAGFNPLQVISEKTGESMVSLKKRMSDGKISAQELAQSFEWATEKGGIFYQGAEKAGATLGGKFSKMIDSLSELGLKVYDAVSPIIVPIVELVSTLLESLGSGIGWLIQKFQEGNPYILGIAAAIGAFTSALILHNTYTALASFFQNTLTLAVLKTNLAFLANPVTWIITGIIALIGVIAYCVYGISGWGKAWQYTIQGVKYIWQGYVSYVKFGWNTLIQGLLIGLNKIKEGWYSFKNAVGMGDEGENNAMLSKIQADTEARKKIIGDSANEVVKSGIKAKESFGKGWNSLEFKSLKEVTGKITGTNTIAPPTGIPGSELAGTLKGSSDTSKGKKTKEAGKKTNEAIATGGTKHNYITISIKELIGIQRYEGSKNTATEKMGQEILDELLRVTASATTAAQ